MKLLDKELTTEDRVTHLIDTMRSQKRRNVGAEPNKDLCSLIDLKTGRIVGSGICPKCNYFLGRADDYRDDKFETE